MGVSENARRQPARDLAQAALMRGVPLAWFEELYARGDVGLVPWADLKPNPHLLSWAAREQVGGRGRRALKIGAGLGDDAEALVDLGFGVVAFDISPSAVDMARVRFPNSPVSYCVGDVLSTPDEWIGAFDFVVEAYTLQVLPPELRPVAAASICATLAPGGTLLVIARGREEHDPEGTMPWPLTATELGALFSQRLHLLSFEDCVDDEDPPVRRLRAAFRRPA